MGRKRQNARKARRQHERSSTPTRRKKQRNPMSLLLLLVIGSLLLVGLGAAVFGVDQPSSRPGAVWSAEHGHYH